MFYAVPFPERQCFHHHDVATTDVCGNFLESPTTRTKVSGTLNPRQSRVPCFCEVLTIQTWPVRSQNWPEVHASGAIVSDKNVHNSPALCSKCSVAFSVTCLDVRSIVVFTIHFNSELTTRECQVDIVRTDCKVVNKSTDTPRRQRCVTSPLCSRCLPLSCSCRCSNAQSRRLLPRTKWHTGFEQSRTNSGRVDTKFFAQTNRRPSLDVPLGQFGRSHITALTYLRGRKSFELEAVRQCIGVNAKLLRHTSKRETARAEFLCLFKTPRPLVHLHRPITREGTWH